MKTTKRKDRGNGAVTPGDGKLATSKRKPTATVNETNGRGKPVVSGQTKAAKPIKIKVDPDFQRLFPPTTKTENAVLEASIIAMGCIEPLIVWRGKNILLDGHRRFEICQRLGLPYRVEEKEFADRVAARGWMIKNQLARRNRPLRKNQERQVMKLLAEGNPMKVKRG